MFITWVMFHVIHVIVFTQVKLKNYIERNNLRLVDFFNKFDKDGSMSVTREEFAQGIEVQISLWLLMFNKTLALWQIVCIHYYGWLYAWVGGASRTCMTPYISVCASMECWRVTSMAFAEFLCAWHLIFVTRVFIGVRVIRWKLNVFRVPIFVLF